MINSKPSNSNNYIQLSEKNAEDRRKMLINELNHLDFKKKNLSLILESKRFQLHLKNDKLNEGIVI